MERVHAFHSDGRSLVVRVPLHINITVDHAKRCQVECPGPSSGMLHAREACWRHAVPPRLLFLSRRRHTLPHACLIRTAGCAVCTAQDVKSRSWLVRTYYKNRIFMGYCCCSCEMLYLVVRTARCVTHSVPQDAGDSIDGAGGSIATIVRPTTPAGMRTRLCAASLPPTMHAARGVGLPYH